MYEETVSELDYVGAEMDAFDPLNSVAIAIRILYSVSNF